MAELATCLRYLRFTADPAFAEALGYLLAAPNEDGSWGSYAAARARLGDRVKVGLYLHTTMVAVEALTLGFEDGFRRGEGPVCLSTRQRSRAPTPCTLYTMGRRSSFS